MRHAYLKFSKREALFVFGSGKILKLKYNAIAGM
jgi:hypothetical protein